MHSNHPSKVTPTKKRVTKAYVELVQIQIMKRKRRGGVQNDVKTDFAIIFIILYECQIFCHERPNMVTFSFTNISI